MRLTPPLPKVLELEMILHNENCHRVWQHKPSIAIINQRQNINVMTTQPLADRNPWWIEHFGGLKQSTVLAAKRFLIPNQSHNLYGWSQIFMISDIFQYKKIPVDLFG